MNIYVPNNETFTESTEIEFAATSLTVDKKLAFAAPSAFDIFDDCKDIEPVSEEMLTGPSVTSAPVEAARVSDKFPEALSDEALRTTTEPVIDI